MRGKTNIICNYSATIIGQLMCFGETFSVSTKDFPASAVFPTKIKINIHAYSDQPVRHHDIYT